MTDHRRSGAVAAALGMAALGLVLGPLGGVPVVADGQAPQVTVGEVAAEAPAADDVTVPDAPVELDVTAGTLRFEAGPGVALELADGRRFLDSLEVAVTGDGQRLVNDLTIDDYVAGVAEMPSRWHGEALKAQAVAARTYAWHLIELGTFDARGSDICDTVDCQVFRGAAQEEAEFGDRWRAAVEATAGEVLVHDGRPILARYFSTSGGQTLPNEVVFPSSGSRPYLVGTDDPQDAISPFHRWEVTFTREEFDTLTAAGTTLAAVTPVVEVERLGPTEVPDAELRFTGPDGDTVTLGSVDVRRFLSEVAPQRFPDRFPSARADGLRPLPATIPSSRFEVEVGEDEVVVTGQGWGHGVGMGQYGALGRAQDGDTYDEILAAYYDGLTPQRAEELPARVRVGLSRVEVGSVRGDGPFAVVADGEELTDAAAGTWRLARGDGGITLTAPPGWGDAASVSRTETSTTLPAGTHAVAVSATSATPGEARLVVRDGDGTAVLDRTLGAIDAGPVPSRWDLRDDDGEPVAAGRYEVAVEVVAADGSRAGTPLPVSVSWPEPRSGPVADAASDRPAVTIVLVVLLLVGVAGVAVRWARRPAAAPSTADRAAGRLDVDPSDRDAPSEPSGQEDP